MDGDGRDAPAGGFDLVAGRFEIVELLGSGGSSSVFAALDRSTGADVALKVLHPHLAKDRGQHAEFLAEAERIRQLRHPSAATVLDAGVSDQDGGRDQADGSGDGGDPVVWLAMELVSGVTLGRLVAEQGPLPVTEALAVVEGVLSALIDVHAGGIVHRDVTPANIMVDLDTRGRVHVAGVRIVDFGLADVFDGPREEPEEGSARMMRGSVDYVSPEHASGRPVGAAADIYQVGAVLYFALVGRPPFARGGVEATLRAHLNAPPPVPSVTDRAIPAAVDRLVVRAMLKRPEARYGSAAEMLEAVHAVKGSSGVEGPAVVDGRTLLLPPVATTAMQRRPQDALTIAFAAGGGEASSAGRAGKKGLRRRTVSPAPIALVVAVLLGLAVSWGAAAAAPPQQPSAIPSPPAEPPAPSAPGPEPERRPQGASLIGVPTIVGMPLESAEALLAEAGLTLGEVTVIDSPSPERTVLAVHPDAGVDVRPGSAVAVTVASGRNTVPDVVGRLRGDAAATLRAAGFQVAADGGLESDAVVAATPAAGAVVPLGSSIALVTRPAASSTPTPVPTPKETPTPAPTPTPTPTPTVRP